MHRRISTQGGILLDALPVGIKADDTGSHIGHIVIDDRANGLGDGLQHFALFNGHDVLEGINIRRMDREHLYIVFQTACHVPIQRAELLQVLPHHGLLLGRLPKDALLHNVGNVLAADQHLFKAILHLQQGGRNLTEGGVVKQRFLHTGDEAELGGLDDFAQLTHEAQVGHQLGILAGAQIVQQLIHDDQITALVAILFGESGHHVNQGVLVVGDGGHIRELKGDAAFLQIRFNIGNDDVPQGHGGGANLYTQHFKLPGDTLSILPEASVLSQRKHIGVCRH